MSQDEENLTQREVELIGSTWAIVRQNPSENGQALLIQFFTDNPQHKIYFPFRFLSNEELNSNEVFQQHAIKVINGLSKIIDAIENTEALMAYLKMNAANHKPRNISHLAYDDLRESALTMMARELGPDVVTAEVAMAYDKALKIVFKIITDLNE